MKIGIVCASDDELAPFLSVMDDRGITEKEMLKFYGGTNLWRTGCRFVFRSMQGERCHSDPNTDR